MTKFLSALAILPFVPAIALAQPPQLTENQLDGVTAGWMTHEIDVTNTSWTELGVYTPLARSCDCYLVIQSPSISVQSHFGPVPTTPNP